MFRHSNLSCFIKIVLNLARFLKLNNIHLLKAFQIIYVTFFFQKLIVKC